MRSWTRFAGFAGRLRRCEGGLAFTEFAMALPVLTTFGLCGLESANLAMAHLRVANIAMMTADNASRVRDSIDEANVIEFFTGAKMTGENIDFRNHGRIILSSMEPNTAGTNGASTGQWIRWQRCDGVLDVSSEYGAQDTGRLNAALQGADEGSAPGGGSGTGSISAASGTAVMVVEVTYEYQPLVSEAIFGTPRIRYESAFNVRQRTNQALTNTNSLSASRIRTCNWRQA